ncbi:fascin-like domain protein [Pandoravirus inopinatum]|uniref:Fascin-like domain protein n=1 Tax=Pandoravirus inopinatum TaxID=1605721 RepID=A0A0B5J7D8_9VIRU|nr:fascin-like domain protein [Pandoravirus inopinatum]AJF97770.1 fascin-like domain protein [Pandoravirus inopinatum]
MTATFKVTAMLVAFLCCVAVPINSYRYTVFLGASTNWTAPVGATGISASLWGGGGGSASSFRCGAGGGSGSAILNRTVGDAQWAVAPSDVQWIVTVGKGGTTLSDDNYDGGSGGDGGQTSVVAVGPDGAELFRATAYGGGARGRPFTSGTLAAAVPVAALLRRRAAQRPAQAILQAPPTPMRSRVRLRVPSWATSRQAEPARALVTSGATPTSPSSTAPGGRRPAATGPAVRAP